MKFQMPRGIEPRRWILTEEHPVYRSAFAFEGVTAEAMHAAATVILRRFLETHALVGLDDVLARYPFERAWAQTQLEEWTRQGRLVRVAAAEAEPLQWSAPENFEQMQRGTLSILRREVVSCPAEQFADFVLRWQFAQAGNQAQGEDDLDAILHRLQGCAAALELWESASPAGARVGLCREATG